MNQKKAVQALEKYVSEYHEKAKETAGKDYLAISLHEHYSKLADLAGMAIRIVENRV